MTRYSNLINPAKTPQTEPLDSRQVENNAGGFVYQIDDWKRLDRFLVLGGDGNTYYQKARDLTRENAACVERCYAADPGKTVAAIVASSAAARAPRNDAAIFALALGAASATLAVRRAALAALPQVCRTSTHLFQFVKLVNTLGRGWGRSLKRAVAQWYEVKPTSSLAYQMVKYRSRDDMTHKRLLDRAHAAAGEDVARVALMRWARGIKHDASALPDMVAAHLEAMKLTGAGDDKALVKLIETHGLPWEAIPLEQKNSVRVTHALLPGMGMTALLRQLGLMTHHGALKPLSDETAAVVKRLRDPEELRRGKIHPYAVLNALTVYRRGAGVRGNLTWQPIDEIAAALDDAFYAAFKVIEPTNKRFLIGLDVSGSMGSASIADSHLTAREAAAAMSMAVARVEPRHQFFAFASTGGSSWSSGTIFKPLNITARDSLDEVVRKTSNIPFGATDCSLPMVHAIAEGLEVDAFVVMTDSETWAGRVHPMVALRQYRKKTGINAKLIVCGMTASQFSIADPDDPGSLDVVGFDANCPALINDFVRG